MEEKIEDYAYTPHEKWYDLLFPMEVKDNRKRAADQIKNIAASKSESANSDSDVPVKVPHKKKSRTGVIPSLKHKFRMTPNQHSAQRY